MSVMAANNFAQDDFFIESQAAEWVRDIKISRPLLEWAGGKTQLLGEILPKIPKKYGRFIEPFFGDGAVFFAARPVTGIVADGNPDVLINSNNHFVHEQYRKFAVEAVQTKGHVSCNRKAHLRKISRRSIKYAP